MAIYDRAHAGYRVFIGDLGARVGKYELERELDHYGVISNVWVARSPPGFAFAVYKHPKDAESAVRYLHGRSLCGRRVRVEHAMPYEEKRRAPPPPARYSGHSRYSRSRSRSKKRSRSRDRHKTSKSRSYRRSRSNSRTHKITRSHSRGRSRSRSQNKKKTVSNGTSKSKEKRGSNSETTEHTEYVVTDSVDGGDNSPVDKKSVKENGHSDNISRSRSRSPQRKSSEVKENERS